MGPPTTSLPTRTIRTATDCPPPATPRSLSVTRAIYLRLPPDARLWRGAQEFVEPEFGELRAVLG